MNANESTCSSLYVDFGEDSYFVMNFTLSSNMYELVYVEAYLGGNINGKYNESFDPLSSFVSVGLVLFLQQNIPL